jgi:ubiquinone/menaquinone biosynthesis C-methylase UbiE
MQAPRRHVHTITDNAAMDVYAGFAEVYEQWSSPMTEDVGHYVALAKEADGPVVELAVGTARVAIPVSQAIGRRVIGIDVSPSMLEKGRAAVQASGADVELREGDMRELSLEEPAALIYIPFRSLLHVPTWADRRRVFERVAASLQPGGRFAWNAFVFSHTIAAAIDGTRREEPVPHTLRYVPAENRVDITLDTGATTSLWWATKNEWLGLIDSAGLEVEALYGGFDRQPFDEESLEYVWVTRKPA